MNLQEQKNTNRRENVCEERKRNGKSRYEYVLIEMGRKIVTNSDVWMQFS